MLKDKLSGVRGSSVGIQTEHRELLQTIMSIIIARVAILGPIERYKIIMQVDHMAKYANANDRPKNFGDLH